MHRVRILAPPAAGPDERIVTSAPRLVAPVPALTTPATLIEAVAAALRGALLLSAEDLLSLLRRLDAAPVSEEALRDSLKRQRLARFLDFVPYEIRPYLHEPRRETPGVFLLQVLKLIPPGVQTRPRYLYVALDLPSRWCFMQLHASRGPRTARHFLHALRTRSPLPVRKLYGCALPRGRLMAEDERGFQEALRQDCGEQGIAYRTVAFLNEIESELAWADGLGTEALFRGLGGVEAGEPDAIVERFLRIYHAELPLRVLEGQTPAQALAAYAVTAEGRASHKSAAWKVVHDVRPVPVEVCLAAPAANDATTGAPPRKDLPSGQRQLVLLAALAVVAGWYGHEWIADRSPLPAQVVPPGLSGAAPLPDYSGRRMQHSWRVRMVLPPRRSELRQAHAHWQRHAWRLAAVAPEGAPRLAPPRQQRPEITVPRAEPALAVFPAVETPAVVPVATESPPPPVAARPRPVEPVVVVPEPERRFEITPAAEGTVELAATTYAEALDHYHAGRLVEAQTLLGRVLARTPDHMPAHVLAAQIMIGQGYAHEALAHLEQARHTDAEGAEFRSLLAWLYQQEGRHAEAAELYAGLLAAQPKEAKWWLGLAISLEAGQDRTGARDAYGFALAAGLDAGLSQYAQQRLRQLGRP